MLGGQDTHEGTTDEPVWTGKACWLALVPGLAASLAMAWDASQPVPWLAFFLITVFAVAIDWVLGAEPFDHARHLSAPLVLAAVLLLPAPPLVLFVVGVRLAGWLHTQLSWRALVFDTSVLLISTAVAHFAHRLIRWLAPASDDFAPLLSAVVVAAILTLNYRVIVAAAHYAAGSQDNGRPHLFGLDGLITQFIVLLLGVPIAVFWSINPWLTIAALAPLLLVHRALNVPALEKEARTDTKTGLHNMRAFNESLSRELQRASRFGHPVSVLMIDLDLLRHVNNSYGHQAGDALLRGVADALRTQIREYDVAARFGGDEFVVLLVECDSDSALQVAERVRKLIESLHFEIPTSLTSLGATVSIGAASFPRHGSTMEEIIYQADQAVYRAKLGGRNRVCLAPPPNRAATLETTEGPRPVAEEGLWDEQPVHTAAQFAQAASSESSQAGGTTAARLPTRPRAQRLGDIPRALQVLMGVVTMSALLTGALSLPFVGGLDWLGLLALVLFTLAAEAWIVDIYGDSSISLMVIPIITGAMLFGVPGGVVIGLTGGVVRGIMRHSPTHRIVFNAAVFVLGASLAANIFQAFGAVIRPDALPQLLGPALCAALIYYAVNTSLISLAMGLNSGQNPVSIWRDHFRWLLLHYVVFGLLALFLASAYSAFGLYGLVAFAVPAVSMRYAMHQYISNTTEHVAELRRLNAEMQRSNEEMARINEDLLNTLAAAIDVRDPYVYGHSTKVAEYSLAIAREMQLSSELIELIRQAALLHDLGKLGIAEAILHKPAKLDAAEYETVKTHAMLGAALLTKMRRLQHLVPAIKHHHEWFNGCGYPAGLAGEEIPVEARILAVSDAIEAMASDRPYHRAMPPDQIIAELERCAGTQFDPAVVRAFVQVAKLDGRYLVSNSALTIRQRDPRSASVDGPDRRFETPSLPGTTARENGRPAPAHAMAAEM